jgi:uncharacterized Zn finger protein
MPTLPKVSDKALRSRVGDRSLALGEQYFQGGAVFNARRQGRTLKARCQGSRDEAYQVEVTFDDKGIAEAECSCPVGDGGHCKHVAALVYAWRNEPEQFQELEELDAGLERRSKAELIALVNQMLRREPDLELLLEKPAGGRSATSSEAYRRKAKAAFRNSGYEWGAASGIADDLSAIKETGDELLRQRNHAGAAAVYEGVLAGLIDEYHSVQDEEGDFHGVVEACVEGLGTCLDALKEDPVRREAILRTLWAVYDFDLHQGGIDLSGEADDFLVEHTTPEERRTIAGWVRAAMPQGKEWDDNWRRQSYGSILLDLEADELDDEAFLRVCRETGRVHDLVDRLLKLRRSDEAEAEAERAGDYDLLDLADLFVKHRQGETADRLIQERAAKSKDDRLLEWLKKRAAGRHDTAAELELAEELFRRRHELPGYQEVRKLAKKQRWGQIQPELMQVLKKPNNRWALIQVYLDEGEIDAALEAVQNQRRHGYGMELEVAKSAEAKRPQAALEIYRKQAEALVQHRSRESYQSACQYLKKVRAQYKRLGEEQGWATYLAGLRQHYRGLPALQDEMNKARL